MKTSSPSRTDALHSAGAIVLAGTTKLVAIPARQFIRRFPQHELPRHFQEVRTHGLLHPKQRGSLAHVKELLHLGNPDTESRPHSLRHISDRYTAFLCPSCNCEMIYIGQIFRKRGPP
ncbi:MAG: transposase [Syntrophobacterales bacterium]|nr:transposase [Syntrophobacterales bacterium]